MDVRILFCEPMLFDIRQRECEKAQSVLFECKLMCDSTLPAVCRGWKGGHSPPAAKSLPKHVQLNLWVPVWELIRRLSDTLASKRGQREDCSDPIEDGNIRYYSSPPAGRLSGINRSAPHRPECTQPLQVLARDGAHPAGRDWIADRGIGQTLGTKKSPLGGGGVSWRSN
jgi:hypothetical protein